MIGEANFADHGANRLGASALERADGEALRDDTRFSHVAA